MNPTNELILQAQNGDAHAFALLYETVYRDLYRFAVCTLRHVQDAEDAVSETVADAFAQIKGLRNAEAFRPWIFRFLSAKCKRRIRQYIQAPDELSDEISAPEANLGEQADVQRAFGTLSREDRLIVSMSVFAGYSSQEIGELLQMNPNTVRSRQSRALKKMAELLA